MISGVRTLLLADATVIFLVGDRIYPVVAEQAEQRNYITLNRTGTSPTIVKNEVSGKDEVNFNVVHHAKTYKECQQMSEASRSVVDNYKGTSEGITYLNIWYQVSQDLYDQEDETYIVIDTYAARVKR